MFKKVELGESLESIAHEFIGDYSYWREIAESNNIDIFQPIEIGKSIKIPSDKEIKDMAITVVNDILAELDLSPLSKGVASSYGTSDYRIIDWVL
ncbi:LysM peptidoglycan-binding domain-containing protein [Nostoc sp. FACHB-973]|nr:LysM peptidoglycan-binding domain-containing protein [Nostoc sp. FACHB-973]